MYLLYSSFYPKSLENSKSAFVCCSDELRGWVCNNSPKSKNCVSTSQYSSSDSTTGSNVYRYYEHICITRLVEFFSSCIRIRCHHFKFTIMFLIYSRLVEHLALINIITESYTIFMYLYLNALFFGESELYLNQPAFVHKCHFLL